MRVELDSTTLVTQDRAEICQVKHHRYCTDTLFG